MSKTCRRCDQPATVVTQSRRFCLVHRRLDQMRYDARATQKYEPSFEELEALIPSPLVCPTCELTMTWDRSAGNKRQLTLQHDRSGRILFLCMSCNRKHASYPGDTFYELHGTHKPCTSCGLILPLDAFYRRGPKKALPQPKCKECSKRACRDWAQKNREHVRAKNRESAKRRSKQVGSAKR